MDGWRENLAEKISGIENDLIRAPGDGRTGGFLLCELKSLDVINRRGGTRTALHPTRWWLFVDLYEEPKSSSLGHALNPSHVMNPGVVLLPMMMLRLLAGLTWSSMTCFFVDSAAAAPRDSDCIFLITRCCSSLLHIFEYYFNPPPACRSPVGTESCTHQGMNLPTKLLFSINKFASPELLWCIWR